MDYKIMRHLRFCTAIILAATLSACQTLSSTTTPQQSTSRIQGNLSQNNGQWLFQPCSATDSYILKPSATLTDELNRLAADTSSDLFADLAGYLDSTQQHFTPTQRYRLQIEGHDCNDSDFARLQVRASGNEPFWSLLQTPQGLIFNAPGASAIVLPYIEEQLPGGRFHLSTEANEQHLRLWLTPQACVDSMIGTVHHLTAQLQWNKQTLNGCASFGALRD